MLHGKYRESWPLPALYSFLSGKSYAYYDQMISHLKQQAEEENLVLKPEKIHRDFEKAAIKAFKFHFPGIRVVVESR